jgi:hypothetical protein
MNRFRAFVSVHAVLLLLFGLGFLIAPNRVLAIYNAQTDPVGELASRAFAVNNLMLFVVLWIGRDHLLTRMGRGLIAALFIGTSINLFLAIQGQMNGTLSAIGWMNVILYLVFALGYGIFLYSFSRTGNGTGESLERTD